MRVVDVDYDLNFERIRGTEDVVVSGDADSLEVFRCSLQLAGPSEGPTGPDTVEVVQLPTAGEIGRLRATQASVALFLEYEALNYL